MKLQGKVALITGAGSGIGRATATLFAHEGARVALVGRTASKLQETAKAAQDAFCFAADLSRRAEAQRAVDECARHFGGLDIVVNNAGISRQRMLLEMDEPLWDELVAHNIKNPFWVVQAAVPWLARRGGGVIINITSSLGLKPSPGFGAYAMTKAAQQILTLSVALEHAKDGIRANAISPAVVDTPIHETYLTPDGARHRKEEMARFYPLGRVGTAEEVAQAALYLASDDARWITGTTLLMDGGRLVK
ncbi:MAG: SDR family oxidoreductase [Acidobacteriia bacterium]|nr:SDR family oxidoreductase [Terriglobia bacterium]